MTREQRRALRTYLEKWTTFTCGRRVKADGSNAQFKRDYDRQGRPTVSVRCLHCNRKQARTGMARLRASGA